MKFNKKINQIVLFALLILIIATGIFIYLSNENNELPIEGLNSDNIEVEKKCLNN